MKKVFLAISCLGMLAVAQNAHAQMITTAQTMPAAGTGFYVDVHGGYNLPMATQNVGYFGYYTYGQGIMNYEYNPSGADRVDDVLLSLGKGANFGVNLGYMFTKNLGAELGVNYLMGAEYTASQKGSGNNVINQTLSAKMLQISPTVVLRGNYSQLNPYAKFGVLIGAGSKVTYVEDERYGSSTYYTKQELEGGTPVGFTGALGLDYAINSQFSVFGELKANSLTYSPEKGNVVVANYNGEDDLQYWDVADRQTVFSDDFELNSDPDQPTQASRLALPFSSIGLNVGVRVKF